MASTRFFLDNRLQLATSKIAVSLKQEPSIRPILYTIGHSNRSLAEFVELLKSRKVKRVVDVRTVPRSRHNSQFNERPLETSLKKFGIAYQRIEALGGFRRTKKDSANLGWRNLSFRGFADYMGTEEFAEGLAELQAAAHKRCSAIMCAEALPWRCNRSLIADALIKAKWNVFDIMSRTSAPKHRLTPFLKMRKGQITYPAFEK